MRVIAISIGRIGARIMGWLRLVGCLKIYVSLQNIGLFCRAFLQKRPVFLSILLIVATPYQTLERSAIAVTTGPFMADRDVRKFAFASAIAVDTATHCNTLYHTTTYCNTLHHTATHCNKWDSRSCWLSLVR